MDAMVEALMPFVMFAAVLWGIEAIVTMLIRDHKKAKRKPVRIREDGAHNTPARKQPFPNGKGCNR